MRTNDENSRGADSRQGGSRVFVWAGALLCAAALTLAGNAQAVDPDVKCESSKLKEAGKYANCRLKAEFKAVKKGQAADYEKCETKFSDKWGKIETKAGADVCPSEGDLLSMDERITTDATEIATLLAGGVVTDCGDGVIEAPEECDVGDLGGEDCVSQGFGGGTIACGTGCALDTSGCFAERFVDNGDGTITDNETGLMWLKQVKEDDVEDVFNVHDADTRWLWAGDCSTGGLCQPDQPASDTCMAQAGAGAFGCELCAGGTCDTSGRLTVWQHIAGINGFALVPPYTDWRVPEIEELLTLVNYRTSANATYEAFSGANCGPSCPDLADPLCSCTDDWWTGGAYWTASPLAGGGTTWVVWFGTGEVFNAPKGLDYAVRAVRGGS